MTKLEFTQRLRDALSGEIPDPVVEDNIRFYDRYISDEIAKGKTEEEVLAGFGEPRLIAKTILETWQSKDTDLEYDGQGGEEARSEDYGAYADPDRYHETQIYEEEQSSSGFRGGESFVHMNGRTIRLDKWYTKLIPIAIIVLILAFVFFVMFGMLKLTIAVLTSPFFWGILLIFTVLSWFTKRR